MQKLLLTLCMAFSLCYASAQVTQPDSHGTSTTSEKESSNFTTTQIQIHKISKSESKQRQATAKHLFETTFDLILTEEEFHSLISSSSVNLEKWQMVFAKYSEDPTTDLEYVHSLINGMQAKL